MTGRGSKGSSGRGSSFSTTAAPPAAATSGGLTDSVAKSSATQKVAPEPEKAAAAEK